MLQRIVIMVIAFLLALLSFGADWQERDCPAQAPAMSATAAPTDEPTQAPLFGPADENEGEAFTDF